MNENKTTATSSSISKPPVYVGYYKITGKAKTNGWNIMFVIKPNIVHRFFCRVLLGWVWGDVEKVTLE